MNDFLWNNDDNQENSITETLEMDLLLEGLYRVSGFDFRQYMRSSIHRRVHNRMQLEQIPTITGVLEKVLHEPAFMTTLLNDFSINVTEMFRNPEFFRAFRQKVIPELRDLQEIRIWHAGCATGEEVYSMAILMEEEGLSHKTKFYATDMNEPVLNKARTGILPLSKMRTYTKNYMAAGGTQAFSEYYTTDGHFAYLKPSLLKQISFLQHNLVTDHSFNEFHVILCRNVLIYFTAALQNQVHELFYDSLSPNGFLGLGDKESIQFADCADKYADFAEQVKIYQKK
ncbi:protein-glutamate O-methyltransferase CheR [Fictibacillus sp. 7GRE50]|uniref:CheR family methyltransferase n=1 Tax=Fictibacillus sp. 7GRE50 TaxID=2745878 RepID=UPI0018CFED0E|nr:protein-glutamate O-methyltransferase CheR [Fictibacillus sp. 7GRE50]MBH0164159.1 protein-glutamate O-methyltransferase CheR [Fictibacillus sp. 7GRE50]